MISGLRGAVLVFEVENTFIRAAEVGDRSGVSGAGFRQPAGVVVYGMDISLAVLPARSLLRAADREGQFDVPHAFIGPPGVPLEAVSVSSALLQALRGDIAQRARRVVAAAVFVDRALAGAVGNVAALSQDGLFKGLDVVEIPAGGIRDFLSGKPRADHRLNGLGPQLTPPVGAGGLLGAQAAHRGKKFVVDAKPIFGPLCIAQHKRTGRVSCVKRQFRHSNHTFL